MKISNIDYGKHLKTKVLIWNNNYKFLKEDFKNFPNISMFINWGTDTSNLPDEKLFKERNIKLEKVDKYSTNAVSEFIIWKSLELLRQKNIPEELFKKNIGIIGMGNIGQKTAEIFSKGFNCNVKYFSRTEKKTPFEFVSLEELLSESDVIIISVKTKSFTIDDTFLQKNKKKPIIINISRDFVFPVKKLFSLFEKKVIDGFLSDNFIEDESLKKFHSNHIAYNTKQARKNKFNNLKEILKNYLKWK